MFVYNRNFKIRMKSFDPSGKVLEKLPKIKSQDKFYHLL